MHANWQPARRLRGFDPCFTFYLRSLVRSNFSRVWCSGSRALPPAGGYIAAANHHSWWDGLIPYMLHRTANRRAPFALMMSEAELRRFPYFRFGGAFSIDASSARAARESISYAGAQARGGAAVWIYPEGQLRAPGSELHFTSGFVHAAREGCVPVIPVAMRFVMLQHQRPEAFVRFGEPMAPIRGAVSACESKVERMLAQIDRAIETQRVESEFTCVLAGKSGVDDRLALAAR